MGEGDPRAVSRAIFQNAYLLEVSAAIARHPKERFIQKDLVKATGIDKALVGTVIKRLEPSGLIKSIAEPGREHPYERLPSAFWSLVTDLLNELRG